jgi:hypothetical protein
MELRASLKTFLQDTAATLRGSTRRLVLARTVRELGPGGQRLAERELGWSRVTVRKGMRELTGGMTCVDAYALGGRKKAEDHLAQLLADSTAIVDSQSQADPQFRTRRRYPRLTAAEVRRQWIAQQGYTDAALPGERTSATKLNLLGYTRTKVAKTRPQKPSPRPRRSSSRSLR